MFYHQFLFPDLNEKFAELSVGWMKLKRSRGVTYMLGQVKSGHLAVSRCGPVQSPLWLKRGVKVEVSQFILQWSNKNGVEWGGAGRVWGLMSM